jgi:photosystem II stability/assembly factor-like uncharacterized protein
MRALSALTTALFLLIAAPAGAAVSTNQSGWLWGSPEPQGNFLTAIEFGGGTGYATGHFGTLLRTNDGGGTWGTVRTGQALDFAYLEMIDGDSVVAASQCAARRTDDGGRTFRRLAFTSNERTCQRPLFDISFPTSDVGYLLTADSRVLRTADGGRSFSQRTAVPNEQGFALGVMFRNESTGLAVTAGGNVFRTVNGGQDWTREFDGDPSLNDVLFRETFAVAVGDGGTFLVSSDEGDTWTRPASEPGAPTPPAQDFVRVSCASPTVCLVVTRTGAIFHTTDGGRSFTDTGARDASAVDYAAAARAVAVGFGGKTQVSDDGGATFSQLGARIEGVQSLTGVRASSTGFAYAFGDGGALARTTDGGESWVGIGLPTDIGVADVWFATASVGYALDGGGALFRTENEGTSWSILETETNRAPRGVYAPDARHVFLVGPRGVLRSGDSGETFERHTHRVIRNRTLDGADDAGSDVVFWGPRVIAVSTNEGDTWRKVRRPTARAEVRHVDFVSSRVGYALDTDGRVYFTRNRGRRWTELIGVGYADGQRLAFGNRRNGWLDVGSTHPNVLRTTDGGRSWSPQVLADEPVIGIAAAGSRTGFATLANPGRILFTQRGGAAGSASRLTLRTRDRTVPRGTKIVIKGRLSPADGGEDVEVRVRRLNGRSWREIDVTPNRSGRFSFKRRIRTPMVFVGQWEGDPGSDGDGTPPLVVRVGGGR